KHWFLWVLFILRRCTYSDSFVVRNKPLSRQGLWLIINDAAKRVELKNTGTHSMRKTFGYFLYSKNSIPIEIIQDLLNHSSAKETLRYIGITQEDKDTAIMSLDL
ncbi:tyrosine-type recombinase/integrase, partial [Carnobacterium maltaromaticum]|uniref:tyrosine-type recombinase/integrase n=1 Tax=Carnobacterium maltaromaticum TaxID=2751 RepID=UPI0012D760E5